SLYPAASPARRSSLSSPTLHTLLPSSSYRPPRDLHSFPTRRSSDLREREEERGEARTEGRRVGHPLLVDGDRAADRLGDPYAFRSEEHTSELQSRFDLVCRLLLEKKKETYTATACNRHNAETREAQA